MTRRIDIMSLPDPAAWSAGPGTPIKAQNYVFMRGGLTYAIGYGRFFWPEFIEVRGYILNADYYTDKRLIQYEQYYNGDITMIERGMNQVDMETIYTISNDRMPENVVDDALDELASIVAVSWRCAAKHQWPDRDFVTGIEEYNAPPSVWITTA